MTASQIVSSIQGKIAEAREMLKSQDWIVLGFQDNPVGSSYSYSIGLSSRYGHPEIVVVGFPFEQCQEIINRAGDLVRERGADFSKPVLSSRVAQGYDVAFRPLSAGASREGFKYAKSVLDVNSLSVVQLFLPDAAGLFPWSRKVDKRLAKLQLGMFKYDGALPMQHAPEN